MKFKLDIDRLHDYYLKEPAIVEARRSGRTTRFFVEILGEALLADAGTNLILYSVDYRRAKEAFVTLQEVAEAMNVVVIEKKDLEITIENGVTIRMASKKAGRLRGARIQHEEDYLIDESEPSI